MDPNQALLIAKVRKKEEHLLLLAEGYSLVGPQASHPDQMAYNELNRLTQSRRQKMGYFTLLVNITFPQNWHRAGMYWYITITGPSNAGTSKIFFISSFFFPISSLN
jgi:hypothetical protein